MPPGQTATLPEDTRNQLSVQSKLNEERAIARRRRELEEQENSEDSYDGGGSTSRVVRERVKKEAKKAAKKAVKKVIKKAAKRFAVSILWAIISGILSAIAAVVSFIGPLGLLGIFAIVLLAWVASDPAGAIATLGEIASYILSLI